MDRFPGHLDSLDSFLSLFFLPKMLFFAVRFFAAMIESSKFFNPSGF